MAMFTWVLLAAPLVVMQSEAAVELYDAHEYHYTGGDYEDEAFGYRLMAPAEVESGKTYPLVLFLHGAGERGDDNVKQLMYFPELMADADHREKYPCYVLAPQCRRNKWWAGLRRRAESDESDDDGDPRTHQMRVVEGILAETLENYPIDRSRVYLTGLSMGGYGSWDLAARHPDWFAAVVPICGGGDASQAESLATVPIWAAHGGADPVVPPARSQEMIEAIRAAGGEPKYTEYEGVGHNSWTPAYEAEDGVIAWMFQQQNDRAAE